MQELHDSVAYAGQKSRAAFVANNFWHDLSSARMRATGWGSARLACKWPNQPNEQNGRTNPFEESAMISIEPKVPNMSRAIATARALRGPRYGGQLQAACSTALRGKITSFRRANSANRSPSLPMEQAIVELGMIRSHRSDSPDRSRGRAVAGVPKVPKAPKMPAAPNTSCEARRAFSWRKIAERLASHLGSQGAFESVPKASIGPIGRGQRRNAPSLSRRCAPSNGPPSLTPGSSPGQALPPKSLSSGGRQPDPRRGGNRPHAVATTCPIQSRGRLQSRGRSSKAAMPPKWQGAPPCPAREAFA
jgi:hypothetical protein